jgi:hypothetical protein
MKMFINHGSHGMREMFNRELHEKVRSHEGAKARSDEMDGKVRELLEMRGMVG